MKKIKNMTVEEMAESLRKKEENKMQDRFRVRVWNKKEKEMIYNAEFAYDGMNYNLEGELIGPNRNDGHICCLAEYLNDSNYESMQCTGLKDKNGKLVYIDDLIRLDDGLIGIVKQVEDVKSIDYGRIIVHLTCSLNKKYPTYYIPTVIAESEIIGNVYTNPELLESNN